MNSKQTKIQQIRLLHGGEAVIVGPGVVMERWSFTGNSLQCHWEFAGNPPDCNAFQRLSKRVTTPGPAVRVSSPHGDPFEASLGPLSISDGSSVQAGLPKAILATT